MKTPTVIPAADDVLLLTFGKKDEYAKGVLKAQVLST
jgi:hypothetical protein